MNSSILSLVPDTPLSADVWLLNSCTVKSPSEDSFLSAVEKGRELGRVVVVAGCVPQGQKNHTSLQGLSAIGVSLEMRGGTQLASNHSQRGSV